MTFSTVKGAWANIPRLETGKRVLIAEYSVEASRIRMFQSDLTASRSNQDLVNAFVAWAGGIDVLLQLSGTVYPPTPWDELTEAGWRAHIDLNLTVLFFLAQTAMKHIQAIGDKESFENKII